MAVITWHAGRYTFHAIRTADRNSHCDRYDIFQLLFSQYCISVITDQTSGNLFSTDGNFHDKLPHYESDIARQDAFTSFLLRAMRQSTRIAHEIPMNTIRVTTLGTGDAFASGGRGHSGILIQGQGTTLLIDPGPTILTAIKRFGIEIATIDVVLLTHLHGDHIAGVPFLLLDYQFASRRTRPLIIAGPRPLATRLERLTTCCYRDLSRRNLRFRLHYQLMRAGQQRRLGAATVTALPMAHTRSTICLGYRIRLGNKLVAFTGDTVWCDSIPRLAEGADLFLTECTGFHPAADSHLDYLTLANRRAELHASRIVLVHVGEELLRNRRKVRLPIARDGQTFLV